MPAISTSQRRRSTGGNQAVHQTRMRAWGACPDQGRPTSGCRPLPAHLGENSSPDPVLGRARGERPRLRRWRAATGWGPAGPRARAAAAQGLRAPADGAAHQAVMADGQPGGQDAPPAPPRCPGQDRANWLLCRSRRCPWSAPRVRCDAASPAGLSRDPHAAQAESGSLEPSPTQTAAGEGIRAYVAASAAFRLSSPAALFGPGPSPRAWKLRVPAAACPAARWHRRPAPPPAPGAGTCGRRGPRAREPSWWRWR